MSKKNVRSGGKYGGTHTTVITAAGIVCDIAHRCAHVTRISPGYIRAGLRSANGKRRVKLTEERGALLLSVRDSSAHQEIRVYTKDIESVKQAITLGAQQAGLLVSFGKDPDIG